MKRFLAISLFIGLLSNLSYSQKLSWVSSNTVAEKLIVHTFKLSGFPEQNAVTHVDVSPTKNSLETDELLTKVQRERGVTRASFDAATQTITILSDERFNANTLLTEKYIIRNKKQGGVK